MSWTLVIHGGAGSIQPGMLDDTEEAALVAGLEAALAAGTAVLEPGGSALDAVEAAARVLEDDPAFNAGRGSVLTYEGAIELDAAIMDGRDRRAGAVAGVRHARNPVGLARAVMDHSPHVLLAGDGADRFAAEQGFERVAQDWFETPARRAQLERVLARSDNWFDSDVKFGTIGAVAVDKDGHVAAATSTGGLTGKRWGRVGDSPLIGSGTYADDRACAVSATGSGEFFIRDCAAHEIGARIRMRGEGAQAAADAVMAELADMGGSGGVIFVTPSGEGGWSFTTKSLFRGRARQGHPPEIGLFGEDS